MNLVLGVGGGIAAYKSAELARALMERGMRVQVVMTKAAREFITPLTFASLTGRKVITGLFSSDSPEETLSSAVEHIAVAQDNDILVIAPATADLLARLAHGLADDFLTTLYLAFTGRVVLAPAMNNNMWAHPATQENLAVLRKRGHMIVEPEEGLLACGTTGPGRLADPEKIADAVASLTFHARDLEGETVLITAGPTQEPLDPVRYISNRSSGKMGYALAEAAAQRGAQVILVSGPVQLREPPGVRVLHVQTAREMHDAVLEHLSETGIIVKAAAVADYHLSQIPRNKIKKTAMRMSLDLDPTPDILAELGKKKGDRLLIGFAAETENLIESARQKLESKNCDMVVANLVNQEATGFESDENEVVLVLRTGETIPLSRAPKRQIADRIFDQVLKLRLALHAAQ
ncbi:MAG TPA: bifunctional phosphopantothenoylcysteine decarboxylase/phosphopantothenate--cysteine ligase CoaBC [Bryobacteraceae bacterium]|jgi:phosphopantothenoylcysteine decarboxylase/phosphopantothenate--cysteine ligase|nr:bifunctional phosphopantothenoylcysteine decarboxylase/phosphopantothenate--cysteine ligase CoaBC [Bryobacteraceae bacterium]